MYRNFLVPFTSQQQAYAKEVFFWFHKQFWSWTIWKSPCLTSWHRAQAKHLIDCRQEITWFWFCLEFSRRNRFLGCFKGGSAPPIHRYNEASVVIDAKTAYLTAGKLNERQFKQTTYETTNGKQQQNVDGNRFSKTGFRWFLHVMKRFCLLYERHKTKESLFIEFIN